MKKSFLIISTIFLSLNSYAISLRPVLNIELESETGKSEESTINQYATELQLNSPFIQVGDFSLGVVSKFTYELKAGEASKTRFNSYGASVEYEKSFGRLSFYSKYALNLIADRDLKYNEEIDGFHSGEVELSYNLNSFDIFLGGDVDHYYGGFPEFLDTPHNAWSSWLGTSWSNDRWEIAAKAEFRQETVIRYWGSKNIVYQKMLLIPSLKKSFKYFEVEALAVFDPFRKNYEGFMASDTVRDVNFGLNISSALEWK